MAHLALGARVPENGWTSRHGFEVAPVFMWSLAVTKSSSEVGQVEETRKLAANIVEIVTRSNASAPVPDPFEKFRFKQGQT